MNNSKKLLIQTILLGAFMISVDIALLALRKKGIDLYIFFSSYTVGYWFADKLISFYKKRESRGSQEDKGSGAP